MSKLHPNAFLSMQETAWNIPAVQGAHRLVYLANIEHCRRVGYCPEQVAVSDICDLTGYSPSTVIEAMRVAHEYLQPGDLAS